MYRAGHLLRRSSVRLKSLSKGHTNLQMIISQLREVRSTFKAFVTAQSTLSEDLVRWSSNVENEALHETFINLAELNSLWTEAQKDFADSLKQFRSHFDLILEGERHVDLAKQNYAAREESERNIRRELQKAYNKATCEEIQLLRDRLNRSEKAKELAHLDVVDRVRENEAVRMIRLKEGIICLGSSYIQMAHKATIIFGTQQKVGGEVPDVHDKAIQAAKYRGTASACHVEEARAQLRCYSTSPLHHRRHSYNDPPPPYSPSRERLNDLSKDLSRTSLGSPSAPNQSMHSLSSPFFSSSSAASPPYPSLSSPEEEDHLPIDRASLSPGRGGSFEYEREPGASAISNSCSPNPDDYKPQTTKTTNSSRFGCMTPPRRRSQRKESTNSSTPVTSPHDNSSSSPPPYNPFFEWSQFPQKQV